MHKSTVSLLESGEYHYIKAISNNIIMCLFGFLSGDVTYCFFCSSRHGCWKFSTSRQPVWGCCRERREATEAGVEGWAPGINRGIQLPADGGEGKAQTQEEKEEEGREGKRAWRGMLVYCVQFPWKCHFGLLYKYIFIYITWKLPGLCRFWIYIAKLALLKLSSFYISHFSMDKPQGQGLQKFFCAHPQPLKFSVSLYMWL